jgi:hypothetical protein
MLNSRNSFLAAFAGCAVVALTLGPILADNRIPLSATTFTSQGAVADVTLSPICDEMAQAIRVYKTHES